MRVYKDTSTFPTVKKLVLRLFSIRPIYIILLLITIIFVVKIKLNNPYRDFSTMKYWESATVESVYEIPDEALELGNKNGPIIMWAAMGIQDTKILKALIDRGADVNESDGVFKGTPLSAAAAYARKPEIVTELIKLGAVILTLLEQGSILEEKNPNSETALMLAAKSNPSKEIIDVLIKSGAKLEQRNSNNETALLIAAIHNTTKGIISILIENGANINQLNNDGHSVFDLAELNRNKVAIKELEQFKIKK